MQELHNTFELLLNYIKGIWIKKRYIIISTWLLCPLGWAYVVSMPDVYQSSAKVYADTKNMLQPLLRGLAITSNPDQELRLIARMLFSRSNLEDIAREADLDLKAQNQDEFDNIVNDLKSRVRISSAARENTFTISYRGKDPVLSQKIVQITLDKFVEATLGSKREGSDMAEAFLDQQIKEYEDRLAAAEKKLADFKRKRLRVIPEASNYYQLVKSEKAKLKSAQLALKELESRYNSVKERLSGEIPTFSADLGAGSVNSIPTQFDNRIISLQSKLDDLLIRYTDAHPEVKEANKLLGRLNEKRDNEIQQVLKSMEANSDDYVGNDVGVSPVYQEMKISLSNLESEIASVNVRIAAFQENVDSLESKMNLVPTIEAESTALNRDYGITKQKFQQLLQRKESARLSRVAGASTDDVKFRIIEPAKLPKKPSGPKRALLYSGVLFAGFGVGITVAFLLSQFNPTILRASQIRAISNFPVFGVVSHTELVTMRKQLVKKYWIFGASCSVVVFIYISLMFIEVVYGGVPSHLVGRFL